MTCNSPLASLFRPEELEEMVIGQRQYDWDAFKKSCSYDGGFNVDHPTIKNVRSNLCKIGMLKYYFSFGQFLKN